MKRNRLMASALSIILVALTFTGCQPLLLPSKNDVMEYKKQLCPTEKVSYEVKEGKGPFYDEKQIIYEFSSEERDLDFEIYAVTVKRPYTNFWKPKILDTYRQNIKKYYKDEIISVFDEYENLFVHVDADREFEINPYISYESDREIYVMIDTYEDLENLIDACYELNVIYSEEEEFNTKDWMEENPLFVVNIDFRNKTVLYGMKRYAITGETDYEVVDKYLTNMYLQAVYDGWIVDEGDYDFSEMHKTKLQVLVDGKEVSRDDINGDTNVNLMSPDEFNAKYNYETDTYYLPINPKINKKANPELLEFYLDCADGVLKKHSDKSTKFKVGSTNYEIEMGSGSGEERNHITSISFKKDGKDWDIDILDKEYEGQYVFYISVDDIAQMFDFEYTIDEDEGTINLEFN